MSYLTDPWAWLIVGVLLCAGEALAPGLFMLWIGLAAVASGIVQFAVPLQLPWLLMVFGALTALFAYAGGRLYGTLGKTSKDAPFLNRRADALIGRETRVQESIVDGFGMVRIDDTVWRVAGPDLAVGTRVRITGLHLDGNTLTVEKAPG